MEILPDKYLKTYGKALGINMERKLGSLQKKELTAKSFTFYTSVAVISSSRIEGEQMEVDSYVKHKMLEVKYLPELVQKPNDLYKAYLFAGKNKLTKANFLKSHVLLSAHLLPRQWQGKYRKNEMLIMETIKNIILYEAAPYQIVNKEMNKLWKDIATLLKKKLSTEEVFYYASFIHIVFVKIHPFNDGNGRAARLLEKWFLAEKLGQKAWYIQSESYYYTHVSHYYKNLNRLGMFYDKLNYSKALPFLMMLPDSMKKA